MFSSQLKSVRRTITLLCALLFPILSYGQIAFSTTSSDLVVCGTADTFTVTLTNQSSTPLSNVSILLNLDDGLTYVTGSVQGTGVTETSNPSSDSAFLASDTLQGFQSVSFQFEAFATCEASDSAAVFNKIVVTHSGGVDSTDSAPFAILKAALSIQSITPSSVTDTLGASFTRCVSFINGGFGQLRDFFMAIQVDTTLLSYSNFVVSATGTPVFFGYSGDSIILKIAGGQFAQIGDMDILFEQNEVIEICYDVQIRTCLDAPSTIFAYWGCSMDVCEVNSQNANVIVEDIAPVLAFSQILDRNTCYGEDSSITKIIVTNTGSGPATNVLLDFWIGGPGGAANYLSSIDTGSIQWVSNTGVAQSISPFYIENGAVNAEFSCLGPVAIRRARVLIPFMGIGEQDTLIYKMSDCCKTWCATGPSVVHRSYYESKYYGQCDSIQFFAGPFAISGYNLGRIVSIAANGPTDINPGDTAQFCIEHSSVNLLSRAPGSYIQVDVAIPGNLAYVGGINDFYMEDPQGDIWNASSFNIIGDTLRGTFLFGPPSGFSLEKSNLKFSVTPNCLNPCDGGQEIISYQIYQIPDTSCSCANVLDCVDFTVNVHCGLCNCADGGLVFRDFTATRDNFGLPDNNDDGVPDGVGVLDSSLIRMNYVMFGDTLLTQFHGTVDTTSVNPFWTGGYAASDITRGNALTAITADLDIYDFSTGNVYNCNIALPTVTNIGGNDRRFIYEFDTASIAGCLPFGFVFEENDSIVLSARYRVSTNLGGVVATQSIINDFELINTTTGDTSSCDAYSGSFVLVGYYYTNCCYEKFNASGCNNVTVSQNYYLSIGNCCSNYSGGNLFKYEYRPWASMTEARFNIPNGYTFVSATVEDRRTAGSALSAVVTNPITPYQISGDTLYFNMDSLYLPFGGNLLYSDDGFLGIFRLTLQATCAVQEGANRVNSAFDWNPVPQLTGPGAAATTQVRYDSLGWQGASLSVTPSVPVVPGIDAIVDWDFQIENSANIHTAVNTWFAFVSPSGSITPVTVTDNSTGSVITPTNGIYQVGDILADSIRSFQVNATYSNCDIDSIQILTGWNCPGYPVNLASAACVNASNFVLIEPQPAAMQATLNLPAGPFDICDSIPIEINVISSQTASINDILVNILLPLTGGLDYAPGSAEFSYPSSGGFTSIPDPTVTGTVVSFNVDSISALIEANDLPGSIQPDSNSFTIRFYLTTDCDFASGRRFLVRVTADQNCGDPIPPVLLFSSPIDIIGATTPYSTAVAGSINQNATCPDNQTLTVSFANTGLGVTSPGDSVFVDFNQGYAFAGNFVATQNGPITTAPVVQVLPGGTRLAWAIPNGLTVGDSMIFSFDVDVSALVACGDDLVTVSTEVNSSLFCARTGTNCSAATVTGSQIITIPITRPDLSMTNFISTIGPGPSGFEYTYSGTIENTGTALLAGSMTNVQFYCDSDQNGNFNPGDILIGIYPTTVGIANGSPHNFSGTFNFNNTVCTDSNQIFAIIAPDTLNGYCLCDSVFANTNVVLPVAWLQARGEAHSQGNTIHWEALILNGHDHFEVEHFTSQGWEAISESIFGNNSRHDWFHSAPLELEQYRVKAVDQNGNHTYSSSVLIDRSSLQNCRFFPNPAHEVLFLDGPGGTPYRILSLVGQEIEFGILEEGLTQIDIQDLSAGVYLIEFTTEAGPQTERLVIE